MMLVLIFIFFLSAFHSKLNKKHLITFLLQCLLWARHCPNAFCILTHVTLTITRGGRDHYYPVLQTKALRHRLRDGQSYSWQVGEVGQCVWLRENRQGEECAQGCRHRQQGRAGIPGRRSLGTRGSETHESSPSVPAEVSSRRRQRVFSRTGVNSKSYREENVGAE